MFSLPYINNSSINCIWESKVCLDFNGFVQNASFSNIQCLAFLKCTFVILWSHSASLEVQRRNCWFHGSSFKGFSIVFLFSDWLKSNHLKSRIERGFLGIFSHHICSAVTETIRVTNYATSFGAKKCSENQVRSCWDDSWSVEPTRKWVRSSW